MKGIIIIGFNKSPGAYIETQYPPNISSDVGLEPTDLMNIYALHRMRKMKPDYQKIKFKNINIASFYTGFSVQRCIGYADKVVTIILSKDEELTQDYEEVLRRYAYEVLPSINDKLFGEEFVTYYHKLKAGLLRPYKKGMYDDDEIELATTSSGTLSDQVIANVIDSHAIEINDLDFIGQFKELEDDDDLSEIENLREFIKEQEITMNNLAEEMVENNIRQDALESELENLREFLQNQKASIDQLVNTNISLKEKISKLRVTTTNSVDSAQAIEALEDKITELETETGKLKKIISTLETDKKELEEKLRKAQEIIAAVKAVPKEVPIEAEPKPIPKPKTKAQVIAKASKSKDDGIREKWLSMEGKALTTEISKSTMNVIRRLVNPWDIKPSGRTKQDLVDAVVEYIKKNQ